MIMTGVDVGRGVGVGLGVALGAGVQVGNMRTRGVEVGGTVVGDVMAVGVDVGEEVQATNKKSIPRKITGNRFMVCFPFGGGSALHF